MSRGDEVLFFLREFLRKNTGLKLLALGMSVALWWFVAGESKVQVGFVVPLEIRNVPPGMILTNKVERQVEVRLAGPPSLLGNLPQSEILAAVDLSAIREGRQTVPLDARSVTVPPGIKVQRIYPRAVEVTLEKLERRRLPVVPRIGGIDAVRRRISKIEASPATLEVEGTAADFLLVQRLVTDEVVPETSVDTYTVNTRLDLREGHARIVGGSTVRVTVHFRK